MDIYGLKDPWISAKETKNSIVLINTKSGVYPSILWFHEGDWQNIVDQLFDFKAAIGHMGGKDYKYPGYVEFLKYKKETAINDNLELLDYNKEVLKYLVRV